jgi:dihydrofolate reductase
MHTVFYAAVSLDGFIAGPNGDMTWAEKYLASGEDYGYVALVHACSAMLMGRKTFEFESDAAPDMERVLPTYVYTSQPMRFDGVNTRQVKFVGGPLRGVVEGIASAHPGKLFVSGGAQLVDGLLAENLLDEIILFVCPEVLGAGTPLWGTAGSDRELDLVATKAYQSGLVELRYRVG